MSLSTSLARSTKMAGLTIETASPQELTVTAPGGKMLLYAISDGIVLSHVTIDRNSWPNTNVCSGYLLVNHCLKGRCEVALDDGSFTFIASGELSLCTRTAQRAYAFPGGHYEGLEFFIDEAAVRQSPPLLNDEPVLDTDALSQRYCTRSNTYVGRPDETCAALIIALRDACQKKQCAAVRLLALSVLVHLQLAQPTPSADARTCYTASQVRIARAAAARIAENLAVHHTVKELAASFHISESSFKNYFRGVFGESFSSYQRSLRLKKAARLLAETDERVAFIASRVGYDSQSKFAAAFKKFSGLTPIAYRQEQQLHFLENEGR